MRGRLQTLSVQRRADYILYQHKNQPLAVIEAKDNKHKLDDGIKQALLYAEALDVLALMQEIDSRICNGSKMMENGCAW